MYHDKIESELARLRFEDYLFLFYGSIILANVFGNYYEKEYLKTNIKVDEIKSNYIFEIILILTLFIYVYLFVRNYNNYQEASSNEKNVYLVRTFGAAFLIAGVLCLIYFQDYQRVKSKNT